MPNDTHDCAILELRQYELRPGQFDALVDVFDEHFIEGQEQFGMRVIGQFGDVNNADRFVWLRGFSDHDARTRALTNSQSVAFTQELDRWFSAAPTTLVLRPTRRSLLR